MAKKVKKDFDKDKMYRKIMPSMEPGVEEQPRSLQETCGDEADSGGEEPKLHNFMEDMMLEKLDRTITVLGACDCERCKMDVMAIALNALPSSYGVVQGNHAMYLKKLKGVYEVKVTASLIKAIQQVKSMPRHQIK